MAAVRSQVTLPASVLHERSTVPSECRSSVGTVWQVSHGSASRMAPVRTCAWWAPTAIAPVAVAPVVETGGAAFAAEPWHEVQPMGPRSSSPSMCWPPATSIPPSAVTVSGWQVWHAGFEGWGASGGLPWQVPQAASPSPTAVQVGTVFVPFAASVAPWQYVVQVRASRSHAAAGRSRDASAPNVTVACGPSTCPGASGRSGTTWHSSQATGSRTAPGCGSRWARCAPTARSVVAPWPRAEAGGAAEPPPPWQRSHSGTSAPRWRASQADASRSAARSGARDLAEVTRHPPGGGTSG